VSDEAFSLHRDLLRITATLLLAPPTPALVATLTDPEPTLIPARGELIDVRWCSVVSAQTLLKPARRTVLLAVLTELAIT